MAGWSAWLGEHTEEHYWGSGVPLPPPLQERENERRRGKKKEREGERERERESSVCGVSEGNRVNDC